MSIGSGGNGTYSATSIPGYQSMTVDNFAFVVASASGNGDYIGLATTGHSFGAGGTASTSPSISYNDSTGVVTVSGCSANTEASHNTSTESGKVHGAVSVFGYLYCFYAG